MEVWRRWVVRGVMGVVVAGLGVVAGDWGVWMVRGEPVGHVVVSRMVVAPLKGEREEYYPDGQVTEVCSQSMLGWEGAGACWSVRRKPVVFER